MKDDRYIDGMARYLVSEVTFIGPPSQQEGKENVLAAARKMFGSFNSVDLRVCSGESDQVMVAYDVNFPDPIGRFRCAGLLTFKEGLISRMELFYGPRPLRYRMGSSSPL